MAFFGGQLDAGSAMGTKNVDGVKVIEFHFVLPT
jgi:hypothetical protein